jgi:hypothetical protein
VLPMLVTNQAVLHNSPEGKVLNIQGFYSGAAEDWSVGI